MPSLFHRPFKGILVIIAPNIDAMTFRVSLERHSHEHLVPPAHEYTDVLVPEDLGVLDPWGPDDVLVDEVCLELVPAVSDEHRDVVHPRVAWRATEQNPLVMLGDLDKRLRPGPISNDSLLVEDEERI